MFSANYHQKLVGSHISALLYADAAAILSRIHIGLKRALRTETQYCKEDQLGLNYRKSKTWHLPNDPKTTPGAQD